MSIDTNILKIRQAFEKNPVVPHHPRYLMAEALALVLASALVLDVN